MSNFFDFPFPVKTKFSRMNITASVEGQPLADYAGGGCVGVRLYLNSLVENTQTNTAVANNLKQIYFGDSEQQTHELLAGNYSPILYCENLSEIFVRSNGVNNPNLQIWIYTKA